MNEQTEIEQDDVTDDAKPFAFRAPYWCHIWNDDAKDDTLAIADSLEDLEGRIFAIGDVLSAIDQEVFADKTPVMLGLILKDYAQQLGDFHKFISARADARMEPLPAKPAPAPKTVDDLRAYRAHQKTLNEWTRDAADRTYARLKEGLAAAIEAGAKAQADLKEAEALHAELNAGK